MMTSAVNSVEPYVRPLVNGGFKLTDAVHFRVHYSFGLCRSETWWDGPQPRMHLNRVSLESENISLVIFFSFSLVRHRFPVYVSFVIQIALLSDFEVFCVGRCDPATGSLRATKGAGRPINPCHHRRQQCPQQQHRV